MSSWGKWGNTDRNLRDKSNSDEQEHYDWYAGHRRRIEENLERFEETKRMIDQDPFGALFGRRLQELYPRESKPSSEISSRRAEDQVLQSATTIGKQGTDSFGTKSHEARETDAKTEKHHSILKDNEQGPTVGSSNLEYDIDPITMRKVLKRTLSQSSSSTGTRKNVEESVNIPVKPFVTANSSMRGHRQEKPWTDKSSEESLSEKPTSSHANTIPTSQADGNVQDWLAHEIFGARHQAANIAAATPNMETQKGNTQASSPHSKIESALDRHLRTRGTYSERAPLSRLKLQYDVSENKTEDVDLLRASDVRAASGMRGRPSKETAEGQQERRRTLAVDYDNRVQSLERQFAEEIAAHKGKEEKASNPSDVTNTMRHKSNSIHPSKNARQIMDENLPEMHQLQNGAINFQIESANTFEERGTKDVKFGRNPTVQDLGAQPAFTQWLHPGEGDMASNVHEFAGRDRWYKQKAPHAIEKSEARVVQAAKDRALIRQVRSIYEDTYGVIDTKHRQSTGILSQKKNDEYGSPPAVIANKQLQLNHNSSALGKNDVLPKSNNSELQENKRMAMIQKLFEELQETQSLIQTHRVQLEKIPTTGESSNLLQTLTASEQRVLQTLKTAWDLLKPSTTPLSTCTDEWSSSNVPHTPSQSAGETRQSAEMEQQASAGVYRILAYDPQTQKVTTAKTTSLEGSPNEKPLTLSEALGSLTNPAKFVPHFAPLNKIGYEVVSGGANMLVFKKVRQENASAEDVPELSASASRHVNPIDGTTTQTGNFASPTGFVNHDSVLPPSASEFEETEATDAGQILSGERVRREEPVFSGSSRTAWQDQYDQGPKYTAKMKSRLRRAIRRKRKLTRMVWVAVWTASCCYAVGLVTEHLRG